MRPNRLQNALTAIGDAMSEVNAAIEEMRSEHDPLASHIFVSRRLYQRQSDTEAANDTICPLASVGSGRLSLGFAGTSKSGNGSGFGWR